MDLGTEKADPPETPKMAAGATNKMENVDSVNILNPYMESIKEKYKIAI